MDTPRTIEPRTAAIVIAAVVILVVVIALVAGGGGDDDRADVASDGTTSSPEITTPSVPADDGPQVPPIDCGALITVSEMEDALGVWDRDVPPDTMGFEGGEACTDQLADDPDFFIRIQPGAAADFLPGARLNRVGSEPVTGVGDGAAWFEGGGGDGVGVLSVRQATPVGVLVFRIIIGRPDVDSGARLEIAKTLALSALPRFPEVEVEEPDPTVITFEREPIDRSDLSFVDNLLAREQAGDWTLGEGLVATLGLFVGETEASAVLGGIDLVDRSGTGVIRLAREYLDAGPDDVARSEIGRLLDELLFTSEELDAISTAVASADEAAAPDSSPAETGLRPISSRTVAQEDLDCAGGTWFGLGCWSESSSVRLNDTYGEGSYRLFHPNTATGDVYGWSARHVALAVEAMEASVIRYWELGEKWLGMPNVEMMLTPFDSPDAFTDTWSVVSDKICFVYLDTPMQGLSDDHFRQRVAAEFATCLIARTFPRLSGTWDFALAIYLSGVVYPDANIEHRDLPGILESRELATTLFDLRSTNWIFFEYLDPKIAPEGIFEMVNALPSLADRPGIAEEFHRFRETLTNAAVPDLGRAPRIVPYEPDAWEMIIDGPTVVLDEVRGFGVGRMHVMVTTGDRACVTYDPGGGLRATWREGAPGDAGAWTENLPDELTGESVFVITTIDESAEFSMEVTKVVDQDDECEEEDDPDGPDGASCLLELLCGPSGYFIPDFEVVTIN